MKRLQGLDPRVGIKRVQVVNKGFMGMFTPQVQWGWQVTLDGKPCQDPVLPLKSARSKAMSLTENLTKQQPAPTERQAIP